MARPHPPGWHPGPSGTPGMRYWNGTGWTAAGAAPPTAIRDASSGMVNTSEPNHLLHLVMTIGTCGLWLPVWLAVTLLDPRKDKGIQGSGFAHPVFIGTAVLAGIFLILTDWNAFVLLASAVAVATGLIMSAMLAAHSARRRRQEKAEIGARADDQHEALLCGDDQWGVFGIKPPDDPLLEPPPTSWTSGRESLVAGVAAVAGVLVFAVTATVNAQPPDRAPRPVSAPTVTVASPASRPVPHAVVPIPKLNIPLPFIPAIPAPLPAPASQPAQASAPPVRMGERAVDGNLVFVVTSVERSKSVANPNVPFMPTTAEGTFLTVHLSITNSGKQPELLAASTQRLRINSAVYDVDPVAALWTLAMETVVSPGATVMKALSFDVPADTPPGGLLELHESSSSRGANVELLPA